MTEASEPLDEELEGLYTRRVTAWWELRRAAFTVVSGTALGRVFALDSARMEIGRDEDCAIRLRDEGVSRFHLRVELDQERNVVIIDQDSMNGSFVNGRQIQRQLLSDGDIVRVGDGSVLSFSYWKDQAELDDYKEYQKLIRDARTGAYRKAHLSHRLHQEVPRAVREHKPISILLFNADRLFEMASGDSVSPHALLRRLAEIISREMRVADEFGVCGDGEFMGVLVGQDEAIARATGERIRGLVAAAALRVDRQLLRSTLSVGVGSLHPGMDMDLHDLLEEAQASLAEAIKQGGNRCVAVRLLE